MRFNRELLKGSAILLICFGAFNVFNLLFHLVMARTLSVAEYGILATLFSLIYITGVFSESIQTVITKYSSDEQKKSRIKNIFFRAGRKAVFLGAGFYVAYLGIAILLSNLLDIKYALLAINGIVVLFAFILPVVRGIMQGKKRFYALGTSVVSESVFKLVLSLTLVFLGFGIYGAVWGVVISSGLALMLSLFLIRDFVSVNEEIGEFDGIYSYAKPTFIVTLALVLVCSIDVIIARMVFTPEVAGSYAIASVLGKIIFWGTAPVSKAMFPISSEQHTKTGRGIFYNSALIVGALICAGLVIYSAFPEIVVRIFSGENLPESASILLYLGLGNAILALSNLALLYKLSRGKIRNSIWLFLPVLIQAGLLYVFSSDIIKFSIAFVLSSALFFITTIILLNQKERR